MRRTSHRDDPERGLSAALKAMAIVAAVGMLALVAGKSAYTAGAATEVAPTYLMLHPARDDTSRPGAPARDDLPMIGAAELGDLGQEQLLPKGAAAVGGAPQEMQMQKSARAPAAPATQDQPVAAF